ncbi:MAG TPA: hypothetical protein VN611_03465 [Patescibacteria group bacterium]|nr:hypothetical protein [Patescibacteria group bacterium]
MLQLPEMYRLVREFPRPRLQDIETTVVRELERLQLREKIVPGARIGITAGSRGIQNLPEILRHTAAYIRQRGGIPCLLAAMGSHGGGTAAGQQEMLDGLGITAASTGAPVVTCADCEEIGRTGSGLPVYMVKSAREVDGILVVNRVKTHTSFKGLVESGLVKKLVVGLGGPKGARQFHSFGPAELSRLLLEMGTVILERCQVLGGLAILENAYEETADIRGVTAAGLIDEESRLLEYSKSLMPSLPVENLDLLIIQEMGKNFSGTGIDTNIVGRCRIQGVAEPESPAIQRIAVLDLSEESHGNATGIGLADFVTRRLVEKMDRHATYLNCLTSTFVVRAAIPMYFDSEEKLLAAALSSLGGMATETLRIAIIPNTLFLAESYVSAAVAAQLRGRSGLSVSAAAENIRFDGEGNITLRVE